MHHITNPGTGSFEGSTRSNAVTNIKKLCEDLKERGVDAVWEWRSILDEPEDGYFAFSVGEHDVLMPGLPLDRVRLHDGDNPFPFQRLYVDGDSWIWPFALNALSSDG